MKNHFAFLSALCLGLVASPLVAQPTISYLHENDPWVPDDARQEEHFGSTLATGDFNDDGLADLVIGVPEAQFGSVLGSGGVHVMLSRLGSGPFPWGQYWDQFLLCGEAVEAWDRFGFALAVGDFDGDGVDDLAIGAPRQDIGSSLDAGLVIVAFGKAGLGVSNARCQKWHQDRPGVENDVEPHDDFGWSLAAGDFNGDDIDDLAVGVPSESIAGAVNAGAVQVFPGQWGVGLVTSGALWIAPGALLGSYQLPGTPTYDARFGQSLTTGDFNGDGADDLAIGIVGDRFDGSVQVVMGFWGIGLTGRNQRLLRQGANGLPDTPESFDYFGWSLAAGDFNRDGFDDLAIGVPSESMSSFQMGAVHVLPGSLSGPQGPGAFFTQDTGTLQDTAEIGDRFGEALATGDFDHDGFDDLAVASPGEGVSPTTFGSGAFHLLNGTSTGLTTMGNRFFSPDSPGVGGVGAAEGRFGDALAAADFDGDGAADLAVGAPDDDPGILDAGSVNVFRNLDFPWRPDSK